MTANDWMIWVNNACDIGEHTIRVRRYARPPSADQLPPAFERYKVCPLDVPSGRLSIHDSYPDEGHLVEVHPGWNVVAVLREAEGKMDEVRGFCHNFDVLIWPQ